MLKELVFKNRSYRRFDETAAISLETLKELVDLARLTASAANRQPLKYLLSWEPQKNGLIFPHLAWAAYLKDWAGPAAGERPTAYIVMLIDTEISPAAAYDLGIAGQTILLGATEKGLGGCMIASIKKEGLRESLGIAEQYEIVMVIALGKPAEKVVIEAVKHGEEVRYWRDLEGVHHVPKRSLEDIIIG
ncbi:MAG: nitroreductase family protein [Syntrophales bacterium]|jgi:nitroreductase|nr:nitroreductase family protein [Syntrophales bacterium]